MRAASAALHEPMTVLNIRRTRAFVLAPLCAAYQELINQ